MDRAWQAKVQGIARVRYNLVTKSLPLLSQQHFCFPDGLDGKESACNAGDPGLILESGRTPGEGKGNPFQYSCLGNPMNREAWRATVHGVSKSWT